MNNVLDGYCQCGCGELTNIFRGKSRKFIAGHQARGSCNSRFGVIMDSSLKEKISIVRKQQGSPWWEGRKHKVSSKKKMSDIRKIIFVGEGNPFFGRKHTEETKEKLRISATKQRASRFVLPSRPELTIHEEFNRIKVDFETEKLINDKFCADIFVQKYNLIIYVDGCYWHACPIHFPNAKKPNTDNARVPYLTKCGFNVEIIWEHDIKNNLNKVIENLCQKYNILNI